MTAPKSEAKVGHRKWSVDRYWYDASACVRVHSKQYKADANGLGALCDEHNATVDAYSAAVAELNLLKRAVNDGSDCLPTCNSHAHDEKCTFADTGNRLIEMQMEIERLRSGNATLTEAMEEAQRIVKNDGSMFAAIMAAAVAGYADAAIVGAGPFDGRHALAAVKTLAEYVRSLRAIETAARAVVAAETKPWHEKSYVERGAALEALSAALGAEPKEGE